MNKAAFLGLAFFASFAPSILLADADDVSAGKVVGAGPFGSLNGSSKYYQDWFPEPFRVEDTAIDNELRFDWEHDERKHSRTDTITAEIQKSVGIATFEIQAPYVNSIGPADGDDSEDSLSSQRVEAFENIELAARVPIYQLVSSSGFFDNSIGFNMEVGIPTNTRFGRNTEIAPGVFDDLAIGEHFSVQTLFDVSSSVGPTSGSRESFEYGLAFGYAIEDEDFKLPHVERLIPSVELVGETALDGSSRGHNALTGTAGMRFELKSIGKLQPSLGVGYVFPIDSGGREAIRWGIISSLLLEF